MKPQKSELMFDHKTVQAKWQQRWAEVKLDQTDIEKAEKPYFNLMMFPYPSAEGLHVGNMYAFTGADMFGRFKRMQGYDVFEPIGLDGFGIHSENYALKIGRHPIEHAKITEKNYYNQLRKIGDMFDWSRTVQTYDPSYYKWTQWIFVQMFKHGLAYRGKANVNWCPHCKTVLADEQVIDGKCERCGNIVEKRMLEQWFFRITAYAEKLLADLENMDWSEKVKVAQANWIGKKSGIEIMYPIVNDKNSVVGEVSCFTTRPDTNFGATFVVLAPENPIINQLLKVLPLENADAIRRYLQNVKSTTEEERLGEKREKTGVFTGLYCLNRLNNAKMPLFVADYVLMGFGTGAVVGVPGHDVRDFEFAKKYDLPIVRVVETPDSKGPITAIEDVQEETGTIVNSEFLNGLDIHEATGKIMDYLEKKGWGKRVTTYHLRDWLISRQRYWGPPIPMVFCEACAKKKQSWFTTKEAHGKTVQSSVVPEDHAGWYPVPEESLPVTLPSIEDYKPGDDGVPPLAKHKEFYETTCPGCGGRAVRETEVSDTFLDSSWYFLRYPSVGIASADTKPFDPAVTKKWLPVDMYTGGAEHSVLHLMYSRFTTMALHDWGYIDFEEPFARFFAHGLVIKDGAKMSKSKGNVVNPDEYIEMYGSDALRMYLMFMGPFSQGGDFRDAAMEGMSRWVNRIWRTAITSISQNVDTPDDLKRARTLARLVKKVGEDLEKRHYNTAIASMMEFTNLVGDTGGMMTKTELTTFLRLLAPFAPFLTEELWQRLHGRETLQTPTDSIHRQEWPVFDDSLLADETVEIVVQINGKVREKLTVLQDQANQQNEVENIARQSPKLSITFKEKSVRKVIFVPGRLINFVI